MPNRIEGYIGCPQCGTALFRLEAAPADMPGVFSHIKIALGDVLLPLETVTCPVESCGAVLELVPEPTPAPVQTPAPAPLPDALADLGGPDTAPPAEEPAPEPVPDAPADQDTAEPAAAVSP